MRNILFPSANGTALRKAALLSLAGAMIAGCFGILHDQITYTISPEYFTRMKFSQFRTADFGLPPRVFVAEIGFLATWWVGLIGAWFLGRIAVRKFNRPWAAVRLALVFVMLVASAFGISGYFWGNLFAESTPGWDEALETLYVVDVPSFNRVAGIHVGSYLGALVGWVLAMVRFAMAKGNVEVPPESGA